MSHTTKSTMFGHEGNPQAWADDARWQTVWLRAIALAWADAEFKQLLLADPHRALREYFDYNLNPMLDLRVVEVAEDQSRWDRSDNMDWHKLPNTRMELPLPPAPASEDQAVAISDYADAGRSYPFTCL